MMGGEWRHGEHAVAQAMMTFGRGEVLGIAARNGFRGVSPTTVLGRDGRMDDGGLGC